MKTTEMRFSDPSPIYTDMATGGDVPLDGAVLVVRTYQRAYGWPIARGESMDHAILAKPRVTLMALANQGEATCYRLDGRTLSTTRVTASHAHIFVPLENG